MLNSSQLTLEIAQKLIDKALDKARQLGVEVAITVVDPGGHLVAFARMDTVPYMAIDSTRRKALTAYNFQMPNHVLLALSQSEPAIAADLAKNADICMLAGGLPIMIESLCVGGLGIGGASAEEDLAIARKAIAWL